MKYEVIDMGSYKAHFIKTDRFKTITIRVCFRDEINRESATEAGLLVDLLMYSSEKYQTRRELVLKNQDLYAASTHANSSRSGRYSIVNCFLSILNEKYTEKGMLEESIQFFSELLFHPNIKNREFDMESFSVNKNKFASHIKGIKENTAKYSMIKMLEVMGEDQPYSIHSTIEQLEKITPSSLYEYYQKFLRERLVDIYILGDYEVSTMKELIKKYFLVETFKRPKVNPIITHDKLPTHTKEVIEVEPQEQSKLSIGCKIGNMSDYERNYVLTIYNIILGGTADSKFFKNIRETYSVAYYVNSSTYKMDNLLVINSGISKENYKLVMKYIKKEMKDMEIGNFTDEDIEKAKMTYLTYLKEVEDSPSAIIESYIAKDMLNLEDIEERKIEIEKVSREEIMNLAKKIKMDTVFLLEGGAKHEGN